MGAVQEQRREELGQHLITNDLSTAVPAKPVRFIRDSANALCASGHAAAGSGACFLRVHVECGVNGQRVWKNFSRGVDAEGFTAEEMKGWGREASEVLAGVVGSVLGAAEGDRPEAGPRSPLDDRRALEDSAGPPPPHQPEDVGGHAGGGGWEATESRNIQTHTQRGGGEEASADARGCGWEDLTRGGGSADGRQQHGGEVISCEDLSQDDPPRGV